MRISDWSSDVCSSDLPEALLELRHHRLAISLGRRIEMADRLQHPRVDKAQEGLVGIAVTHLLFSAAFFFRIASWKRSAQPGLTSCSPRTRRSPPSPPSRVTALPAATHASRPLLTGARTAERPEGN